MKAIKYLRNREWSMGNGQCPECHGSEPGKWAPHPCVKTKDEEGHQPKCSLAESLEELGEKVIYALLTKEMKEDWVKENMLKLYCDTLLGKEFPEGSLGRTIQEEYWKKYGR